MDRTEQHRSVNIVAFFAPNLTIEGEHKHPWKKYMFEECCWFNVTLRWHSSNFNQRKWSLVTCPLFLSVHFIIMLQRNHINLPARWLAGKFFKTPDNQQPSHLARHSDPSCALWLQLYVYIFIYVYMYEGVGRTSVHLTHSHQTWLGWIHLYVCDVMCIHTTSQIVKHMRNICHCVIRAIKLLLLFFGC